MKTKLVLSFHPTPPPSSHPSPFSPPPSPAPLPALSPPMVSACHGTEVGACLQVGRAIVSNTQEGYCQLILDSIGCLQSAIFCTSKPKPSLPSAMLLPLIGLPITYLQPLQHAREAGTQADPQESLKQPWTGLLYHESFPQLRSSLIADLLNRGQPLQELDSNRVAVNSEAAVAHVQSEVMDHVKQLGAVEFPQYDVSVSVS